MRRGDRDCSICVEAITRHTVRYLVSDPRPRNFLELWLRGGDQFLVAKVSKPSQSRALGDRALEDAAWKIVQAVRMAEAHHKDPQANSAREGVEELYKLRVATCFSNCLPGTTANHTLDSPIRMQVRPPGLYCMV